MKLTVTGMQEAHGKYLQLWGFYVRGFKPWNHCQDCFYGTREPSVRRDMQDSTFLLSKPTDYFYLCGVASGPRHERGGKNLHLAVRPKPGDIATVRSVYGPVFTIHDAEEIQIQGPIQGMPPSDHFYANCKNFRFAAQMYEAPHLGPDAMRDPLRIPREYSPQL